MKSDEHKTIKFKFLNIAHIITI